jgi:hypothetical protein
VINEILFNPVSNGYDYVEFYNRSNKVVDMNQIYVSITQLSSTPRSFFPDQYYAFSENSVWVEQNYIVENPDKMLRLSSLPSFPDDDGIVVLLNHDQTIIDELHYDHSWQFALISNEAGVALERMITTNQLKTKTTGHLPHLPQVTEDRLIKTRNLNRVFWQKAK